MMDQEPDIGNEPLPPPTEEEERADAWEYWHERAYKLEAEVADLLVALRTVMGDAEHGQRMTWTERCSIGRDAIAKATGERLALASAQ